MMLCQLFIYVVVVVVFWPVLICWQWFLWRYRSAARQNGYQLVSRTTWAAELVVRDQPPPFTGTCTQFFSRPKKRYKQSICIITRKLIVTKTTTFHHAFRSRWTATWRRACCNSRRRHATTTPRLFAGPSTQFWLIFRGWRLGRSSLSTVSSILCPSLFA